MFYGNNESGREFDVIDEDGETFAGFDSLEEALAVAKALPWYYGMCRIRRDTSIRQRKHEAEMAASRDDRANFWTECA